MNHALEPFVDAQNTASGRPWLIRRIDDAKAFQLSQRLGLPDLIGRLLTTRGINDADAAERFLTPRLRDDLPDPSHLLGLDAAVSRLADAIQARETIGIIGDYDVDGATSSALMARYLNDLDTRCAVEIPDRFADGYGPNITMLKRLKDQGCNLVLTLDCGTTANQGLSDAASLGQTVIVIDHHVAENELPPAHAIINPNRRDQVSDLGNLAAVGVVFVTLVGLNRELRRRNMFTQAKEPDLLGLLDLVALGTVCDVVPLTGLNRALVAQGLKVMARGGNPGIQALAARSSIKQVKSTMQLGFSLGPRINAGGRLGFSALGFNLLSSDQEHDIRTYAERLHGLNAERQRIERLHTEEAKALVEQQGKRDARFIVIAKEGWHKGVIGIVASRIADKYDRPCLVIAIDDHGIGTGSARSRGGFDLGAAVLAIKAQGYLLAGGGHAMAAGVTLNAHQIAAVEQALNAACVDHQPKPLATPLQIDSEFSPGALNQSLAQVMSQFEPFGNGNEEPVLSLRSVSIGKGRILKDRHIATTMHGQDGSRLDTIAFSVMGSKLGELLNNTGTKVHLAGKLRADEYQGRRTVKLQVEDAAPA